ncbi:zinc finger protein 624-like isoform X2 [Cydia fagiglandana]|uniref:zinc finger protein 624-like isoform X2 n=1 Tax=Cydia fagiglandana TaxID=1458189 RepID=UPI002FEE18EF
MILSVTTAPPQINNTKVNNIGNNSLERKKLRFSSWDIKTFSFLLFQYLSKAQALKKHLDWHNNVKQPKTKKCNICGHLFLSNRILRYHTYTHTGERPYQCPHCETAFSQPHCLRIHLLKQHNIDARVKSDGTITEITGTKIVDCVTREQSDIFTARSYFDS